MSNDSRNSSAHSKNTRREARELVLRMLFQIDLGKQPASDVIIAGLGQSQLDEKNSSFAVDVTNGTLQNLKAIDRKIQSFASDWTLDRQAAVDRNILRLATYEILYLHDAPVAAVVNEAVELAKKYSTAESGKFVNGILGAIARQPVESTTD